MKLAINVTPELRFRIAYAKTIEIELPEVTELQQRHDELLAVMSAIVAEVPRRSHHAFNGNAPGHAHRVPGIWDSDNGELSGKECGWCKAWHAAVKLASREGACNIANRSSSKA